MCSDFRPPVALHPPHQHEHQGAVGAGALARALLAAQGGLGGTRPRHHHAPRGDTGARHQPQ